MRIDFVSDVACPWCAVGLHSLEKALAAIGSDIAVDLHFQPFELNPKMAPEGADAGEYLKAKYGMSDAVLQKNRENLHQRGASVGFTFGERSRVWNTFDAHRLLHWAALQDQAQPGGEHQRRLKHALLQAYHGQGLNPSDPTVLQQAALAAGLDGEAALAVLHSDRYAAEVRQAEGQWQQAGINSVPAIVINQQHLISGGQPPEVFESALRKLAAQAQA